MVSRSISSRPFIGREFFIYIQSWNKTKGDRKMIIVMKMTATEKDVEKVSKMVTDKRLNVSVVNGTGQ